jgi:hypothetical protein
MRVRTLVLVLLSACGNVGGDCQQEVTKQLTISTPADAPLQLRVDQCQVDVDACPALCSLAAQRANLTQTPQSCDVKFGATEVELDIKYQDFTGGIGCPGPEPQPEPGSGVGFGGGK